MKRFLVVLVLIMIGIAGLGFYQGWFRLSKDGADDKVNVTLTVDQDKFKDDTHRAEKQVQDLGHQAKERIHGATDKVRD
jgi:hypothetical protein